MFPPFDEEKALDVLRDAVSMLCDGSLCVVRVTEESQERKGLGLMLGCLVCADASGNEKKLLAVSGTSRALEGGDGFDGRFVLVPPVVSAGEISGALFQNDAEIHSLTEEIKRLEEHPGKSSGSSAELREKRRILCAESLEKVHSLYSFSCADGKKRPLSEICRIRNGGKLPPTGTGDCTAPKLLDYAFSHGLEPVSLAEIFYGNSKNRDSLEKCSPCDSRCGIVLPVMLGLEILYRDESICVVNKQSGLLSVPGRGPEKADSVETRFRQIYGSAVEPGQPAVHRLDMETSGLMVLAFTKEAHRKMNMAFEAGEVQKEYAAFIDGNMIERKIPSHGMSELYFRLDVDNRPHQIWDEVYGKKAVTEWFVEGIEKYTAPDGSRRNVTRVRFVPHTGRTHQLRLASSDSHGFGIPIVGDTLYGTCAEGERLMLHSAKISFPHPVSGERMSFECRPDF